MQKWLVGTSPITWNSGSNWPRWSEIAHFRSLFDRSTSAVTPSEKKLHLTPIGSTLRAFQWAKDEHRTLSLSPQRVAQKRKVLKIWTISCDISETVRCQLLLITNRKSRTGFLLILISMTLDDLERRNSLYFAFFFGDFGFFAGQIRHIGWRKTYNVRKYCLPVPVFHFWP